MRFHEQGSEMRLHQETEGKTMRKIIFATGNEHKLQEIREILSGSGLEIISMREAGVDIDIVENGTTFEENALIKAKAVCEASGEIAMADDSGLEIDYLNKAPGVYSSRFMGEDTSYQVKNTELVRMLEGVPDEKRTARFVCCVACVFPDGHILTDTETMEGLIAYEPKGEGGFGYDPSLYVPENGCTNGQLPPGRKNEISHRGKALRAMKHLLEKENLQG